MEQEIEIAHRSCRCRRWNRTRAAHRNLFPIDVVRQTRSVGRPGGASAYDAGFQSCGAQRGAAAGRSGASIGRELTEIICAAVEIRPGCRCAGTACAGAQNTRAAAAAYIAARAVGILRASALTKRLARRNVAAQCLRGAALVPIGTIRRCLAEERDIVGTSERDLLRQGSLLAGLSRRPASDDVAVLVL